MCMPMGGASMPRPASISPAVPADSFATQLTAQLNPKNPGTITTDNPLLTKGQRVKLSDANAKREAATAPSESTGAQYLQ